LIDDANSWLGVIGLKLVNTIVAAIASFISLRFFDGLSTVDRWTTFFGGWALAAWGGEPLTVYMGLAAKVEVGLVILIGLFGIAASAEVMKFLRTADWVAILDAIRGRKTGG
jgi:hypothetical protein